MILRRNVGLLSLVIVVLAVPWMPRRVWAQIPAEFSAPRMGHVYDDQIRRIRPVVGITGNASIADPMDIGQTVTQVVLIPVRDVAICFSENGVSPTVIDLKDGSVKARLENVPSDPSKVAPSSSGSAAAFYYGAAARVLIVGGLGDTPQVIASFDLPNTEGELRQLAVNDEGSSLIAVFSSDIRDVVLGWHRGQQPRLLTTASRISSLAFIGNDDVVVADSDGEELYILRNVSGTTTQAPLTRLNREFKTVVTTVPERGEILIANTGSGVISVMDAQGVFLRSFACSCSITGFYPLNNMVFRLTERLDKPIFILDVKSPSGRIAFIPAIPSQ
jgi:hypothetical protein